MTHIHKRCMERYLTAPFWPMATESQMLLFYLLREGEKIEELPLIRCLVHCLSFPW